MSVTVGQIEAIARMRDDMSAVLKVLKEHLEDTGEETKKTTGKFGKLQAAFKPLKAGVVGVAGALAAFTAKGVQFNKQVETATLRFQRFFGSAESAKGHVQDLTAFAASTPFQLPGIIEASQHLLTFGGHTLGTEENLRMVGDAAAAVNAPIEEVGMWVGRMYTNLQGGKPIGEAAARLQEMGLLSGPARDRLEEIAKEGKGAAVGMEALRDILSSTSGGMEALSQTTSGLESTFMDLTAQAAGAFADATGASELYRDVLIEVNKYLTDSIEWIGNTGLAWHDFVAGISMQMARVVQQLSNIPGLGFAQELAGDLMRLSAEASDAAAEIRYSREEIEEADDKTGDFSNTVSGKATPSLKELEKAAKAAEKAHKLLVQTLQKAESETFRQTNARLIEMQQHLEDIEGTQPPPLRPWQELAREFEEGINTELEDFGHLVDQYGEDIEDVESKTDEWKGAISGVGSAAGGLVGTFASMGVSIVSTWQGMVTAIKSAELASVILAIIGVIAAAIKWIGNLLGITKKASEEARKMGESFKSAFEAVGEGAMTTAEAMERVKWTGDQSDLDFLKRVTDDYKLVGKTATEASADVGRFFDLRGKLSDATIGSNEYYRIKNEMDALVGSMLDVADAAGDIRSETEILEREAIEAAKAIQKAWDEAYSATTSAFFEARDAGIEAYDEIYQSAIENGKSIEEATKLASDAQIEAVDKVLQAERDKFVRTAAFEAALAEIRAGNAENAVSAAISAANDVAHAWDVGLAAVGQASHAVDQAMSNVGGSPIKGGDLGGSIYRDPNQPWWRYGDKAWTGNEPLTENKYQSGSGGIRDFGRGTLAMLHGNEAVMTQDQIERLIAAASGGGQNITVKVELSNRSFSRGVIEETGREVSLRGI